jgi:nucleotide-binding universal stress UspA family protein
MPVIVSHPVIERAKKDAGGSHVRRAAGDGGGAMFERILLAVDGSEPSRRAEKAAAEVAGGTGAEVLVLHVRELDSMGRAGPMSLEDPGEAADLVNRIVTELQGQGVKATGQAYAVLGSNVAPHIISTAEKFGAGMIVLGTRGMSDFASLLVGSVAHKVIHHAHCPVLVTR